MTSNNTQKGGWLKTLLSGLRTSTRIAIWILGIGALFILSQTKVGNSDTIMETVLIGFGGLAALLLILIFLLWLPSRQKTEMQSESDDATYIARSRKMPRWARYGIGTVVVAGLLAWFSPPGTLAQIGDELDIYEPWDLVGECNMSGSRCEYEHNDPKRIIVIDVAPEERLCYERVAHHAEQGIRVWDRRVNNWTRLMILPKGDTSTLDITEETGLTSTSSWEFSCPTIKPGGPSCRFRIKIQKAGSECPDPLV